MLFFVALAVPPERARCAGGSLRIATYNASLYGDRAGQIHERLSDGRDEQAEKIATIVQIVRPDILLINEIDYDHHGATAKVLAEKFLAVSQQGFEPIAFPFVFAVPSNTGIDSGLDLDGDGELGQPGDAWGYGIYPGQYSMALFSRFPIEQSGIRTFQHFRWKDLPGATRPSAPGDIVPFYSDKTWSHLRLSSKNHVSIPLMVHGCRLHVLASHPTPPVFDGAEDRNGWRNHDEIAFWTQFLTAPNAQQLVDDQGRGGGLPFDSMFVLMGDLNADPAKGDSRREAIVRLLAHDRLADPLPLRGNGPSRTGQAATKRGAALTDTAEFGGDRTMRVDYVLPSRTLTVRGSGVFWPREGDPQHALISASDHRMVWIEVSLP